MTMIEIRTPENKTTKENRCALCSNEKGLKEIVFNSADGSNVTSIMLCENCQRQFKKVLS